jgi:hypothetical protein
LKGEIKNKEGMNNRVSTTGKYIIEIRKRTGNATYHGCYTYNGHVMRMDKPKKGQLVRMPHGDLFKIVDIGTERKGLPGGEFSQQPAVYMTKQEG